MGEMHNDIAGFSKLASGFHSPWSSRSQQARHDGENQSKMESSNSTACIPSSFVIFPQKTKLFELLLSPLDPAGARPGSQMGNGHREEGPWDSRADTSASGRVELGLRPVVHAACGVSVVCVSLEPGSLPPR